MNLVSATYDRSPRRLLRARTRSATLGLLTICLAVVGALVAPAPRASAEQIGGFAVIRGLTTNIDYIDFTMINASSSLMTVVQHAYDGGGKQLAGNELYDHATLPPGDFAEYAAKGQGGRVAYTWSIVGTKYQVRFASDYGSDQDEHIYCTWYQNGDYGTAISDAPYTCAVDVQQGQYGHTTEYMTVADKDISALDKNHQAATLRMVDKICGDSNGGKAYPLTCAFDQDLTGSTPEPVEGEGLPTVVAQGRNCLPDRDTTLSTTEGTTVSNTVGWQETTTVGGSFKWIWPDMYEATISFSQSFAYSSSTTTTSIDSTTYSAPLKPLSAAQLTVVYPVVRLTRDVDVKVGNSRLAVKAITITLRKPDAAGTRSADPIPAEC